MQCLSSFLYVIFFIAKMAQKVNKATDFAFLQLTELQPDLYDKSHPEGQCGSGVGRNFTWLERADIFLLKPIIKLQYRVC